MSEESLEYVTFYQLQVAMEHCLDLQNKLDTIVSMESYVQQAGKVDKKVAEAMVLVGALDPSLVPVESFSVMPSRTNYDVSMESMSNGRKGIIALLIAGVIALVAKLIAFLFKKIFGGSSEYGGKGSGGGGGKSKSKGRKGFSKKGKAHTKEKNIGAAAEEEEAAMAENLRELERVRVDMQKEIPEEAESVAVERIVRYYRDAFTGKKAAANLTNRFNSTLQVAELENDPTLKPLIAEASPYMTCLATDVGKNEWLALLHLRHHVAGLATIRIHDTIEAFMIKYEKEIGVESGHAAIERNKLLRELEIVLQSFVKPLNEKAFAHYPSHTPLPVDSFRRPFSSEELEKMYKEMVMIAGNMMKSREDTSTFRQIMQRVGNGCFTLQHSVILGSEVTKTIENPFSKEPSLKAVEKSLERPKKYLEKLEKTAGRQGQEAVNQLTPLVTLYQSWSMFYMNVWIRAYSYHQELLSRSNVAYVRLNEELIERIRPIILADVEEHCQQENLSEKSTKVAVDEVSRLYNMYSATA